MFDPPGEYCPLASAAPTACPQGYYCAYASAVPEPCPLGTYGNRTELRRVEECTACDPGQYCDGLGLVEPRGPCDPGFYCERAAYRSNPSGLASGDLCPAGSYCPIGSSTPTACEPGTFNNFTTRSAAADCAPCSAGSYCEGYGNTVPTGLCLQGHFCSGSATTPT